MSVNLYQLTDNFTVASLMKCFQMDRSIICITIGDITDFVGDAIVNPANTLGIMGGGVALAIKKKAGPEIEEEATSKAPISIGEAIVTSGYRLKAANVIHAPTVVNPGDRSNTLYVVKAVQAALNVAVKHGLKSVSFPLMGAGTGGLSIEDSVLAMLNGIEKFAGEYLEITIYVKTPIEYGKVVEIVEKFLERKQSMKVTK